MVVDHRLRPLHPGQPLHQPLLHRVRAPAGAAVPDAEAGLECASAPMRPPSRPTPIPTRLLQEIAQRSGFEASPSSHGWRMIVPLQLDRRQAVYVGHAGTDPEGRSILALVSVCGPANDRDTRILLKLNAEASTAISRSRCCEAKNTSS